MPEKYNAWRFDVRDPPAIAVAKVVVWGFAGFLVLLVLHKLAG